ncbi:MAG: serpin family protein [Anaerolineaceae bacterium]
MKIFSKPILFILVLSLFALTGCTVPAEPTPIPTVPSSPTLIPTTPAAMTPTSPTAIAPQNTVLQSEKPRLVNVVVPTDDLSTLEAGIQAFSFQLYQTAIQNTQENLFFSPYSINLALAMTYGGAAGDTATQMADAMQIRLAPQAYHSAFNQLSQELASRTEVDPTSGNDGFKLNIVNAIWGQAGFPFQESYLDLLAEYYGAGLRTVDYVAEPEAARELINQWVEDQTNQKIKDLIPQGAIDPLTRLVLTNAIYFNAAWQQEFDPAATQTEVFHLLDGTTTQVSMMHSNNQLGYFSGDHLQVVDIPYIDSRLSMTLFVPNAGNFQDFEKELTPEKYNQYIEQIASRPVDLGLPKFKFESTLNLNDALISLGMKDAFDANTADFSGIDGQKDLYISDVLHKAYVSVDESGTEAAAATAVIVGLKSVPADPVQLTIDRPFLFVIRDRSTGTILFIGRVLNPQS